MQIQKFFTCGGLFYSLYLLIFANQFSFTNSNPVCNVAQRVLRQHWAGFLRCPFWLSIFEKKCHLEPQGQHYIKFFLCSVIPDGILLGQYCTDTIPVQCWPWGSREQYFRKNLVHCCLNALRATLHRSKPYVMLLERLQTTLLW